MITYKYNEQVPAKALADLREAVGWNRMESEYRNTLMTSYYHIAVYEDDRLIGYIDSVSNGVTDAYIQDLMVSPDYQGKGIGTDLMNKMIGYLKEKHIYMISVVYDESLKQFYERFGFHNMLCGQMETY
ncbi:MAG: GNAT family N-acetyltransferase [Lachnospiraceae bacterium]|nr:GNAT family N-acetyltransferase [Lachnospiraceae bacterium]